MRVERVINIFWEWTEVCIITLQQSQTEMEQGQIKPKSMEQGISPSNPLKWTLARDAMDT